MQLIQDDRDLMAAHFDSVDAWKPRMRIARPVIGGNRVAVIGRNGQVMVKSDHINFKKLGKGIGKFAKKVGKTGLNPLVAIKKTAGVIKKVTMASVLLPLLPLKRAMVKGLKKQGVAVPKKFEDIVRLFASKILGKHYEEQTSYYEDRDNFLPLVALVPPILGFFKQLIDHKKAGAKLTPTEQVIAGEASKVIDQIKTKATEPSGDSTVGSNSKDNTGGDPNPIHKADGSINFKSPMVMGAIAGVILLVFIMMRK